MTFTDSQLAQILDTLSELMPDIVASGGTEYTDFIDILGQISSLPDTRYPMAWSQCIRLYEIAYDGISAPAFDRTFQSDLASQLIKAIPVLRDGHRRAIARVVRLIMEDKTSDHTVARRILSVIVDDRCACELPQAVFDEAQKRAEKYPREFGPDLLRVLADMKHKVFWLDLRSLQDFIMSPRNNGLRGVIALNRSLCERLCGQGGVFATINNPGFHHERHGRVFRRLEEPIGRAAVRCVDSAGVERVLAGKSLSLRGIYCDDCILDANEPVQLSLTVDTGQVFDMSARVSQLHYSAASHEPTGRGFMFTAAGDHVVRQLFEYVIGK